MISVNRHTQLHLQEISSLLLKHDAHKENIEADFLLYCITERDLKLSYTNLLFTQRCINEPIVPHLNEFIDSIKLLALGMTAKDQGNPESISQVEYFILTNTAMYTRPTPPEERGESFMPHGDFGS